MGQFSYLFIAKTFAAFHPVTASVSDGTKAWKLYAELKRKCSRKRNVTFYHVLRIRSQRLRTYLIEHKEQRIFYELVPTELYCCTTTLLESLKSTSWKLEAVLDVQLSMRYYASRTHCLKITQNVEFKFLNMAISTNFCPIKTDLSGNTVWQQGSGFQKLAKPKWTIFGIFN